MMIVVSDVIIIKSNKIVTECFSYKDGLGVLCMGVVVTHIDTFKRRVS